MSELVGGGGRECEDATIFGALTIFEALLNMSQRFACFTEVAIFLVKAKCHLLSSAES